jgi:hypothetical protein
MKTRVETGDFTIESYEVLPGALYLKKLKKKQL